MASLPPTGTSRVGPIESNRIPSPARASPKSNANVGDADCTKNVPNSGYCPSARPFRFEARARARWKVA